MNLQFFLKGKERFLLGVCTCSLTAAILNAVVRSSRTQSLDQMKAVGSWARINYPTRRSFWQINIQSKRHTPQNRLKMQSIRLEYRSDVCEWQKIFNFPSFSLPTELCLGSGFPDNRRHSPNTFRYCADVGDSSDVCILQAISRFIA